MLFLTSLIGLAAADCIAPLAPISPQIGQRCGASFNLACAQGDCCSFANWCGNTSAHCNSGCQVGYGKCVGSEICYPVTTTLAPPSSTIAPTTTLAPVPATTTTLAPVPATTTTRAPVPTTTSAAAPTSTLPVSSAQSLQVNWFVSVAAALFLL